MLLGFQFSFRVVRKKPRNYREWLSYVNLKAKRSAVGTSYFPDCQHLYFSTSRERLYVLLNPGLILFILNNFRAQNHGSLNGVLMHHTLDPFATQKPAFWCQKDEDQYDHTQKVPLPGVSCVIPEEDLLNCG